MKIIKTIPLCGHVDFLHRVLFVTQLPPQTFAFPKAAAESSAIVTDTPPTWFPWAAGVCFFKYFVSSFWDSISKEKSNHIMRLEWNFWVWGMTLQMWKRERTSHVPFCSPPTSLRHMVWLLAGDFAQGDDQEFSQPQLWETSVFFQEEGRPGAQQPSLSSVLGASESTAYFCCPHWKNMTISHLHNIFQGTSRYLQIVFKFRKGWRPMAKYFFFEQLLFIITKRVPEVSIYPTHIKNCLLIYGNPFFRSYVQCILTPRFGLQVLYYMSVWAYIPWCSGSQPS